MKDRTGEVWTLNGRAYLIVCLLSDEVIYGDWFAHKLFNLEEGVFTTVSERCTDPMEKWDGIDKIHAVRL